MAILTSRRTGVLDFLSNSTELATASSPKCKFTLRARSWYLLALQARQNNRYSRFILLNLTILIDDSNWERTSVATCSKLQCSWPVRRCSVSCDPKRTLDETATHKIGDLRRD